MINLSVIYPIDTSLPAWWWLVPLLAVMLLSCPLFFLSGRRCAYLAIVSLIVFLPYGAVCIRGYYRAYRLDLTQGHHYPNKSAVFATRLYVQKGEFGVFCEWTVATDPKLYEPAKLKPPLLNLRVVSYDYLLDLNDEDSISDTSHIPSFLGFKHWSNSQPQMAHYWTTLWIESYFVPMWAPAILLLIFPSVWVLQRYRHSRRKRLNICVKCGYDLRRSAGNKCPECANSIPTRKEIAKAPDATKPVG